MPSSKSITMYQDVKLVLDAAIAAGGGIYTLATHGKAIQWRQRAYYYRRLLRDAKIATTIIPGLEPTTPYDNIELFIANRESCDVIIRPIQAKGVLKDSSGKRLNLNIPFKSEPTLDELDATALDLISRHGG